MANRRRMTRRKHTLHRRRRGRGFFDFLKPVANLYGKVQSAITSVAKPITSLIPGPVGTALNTAANIGSHVGRTFEGIGIGKYHRRYPMRISHHQYSRWKHT